MQWHSRHIRYGYGVSLRREDPELDAEAKKDSGPNSKGASIKNNAPDGILALYHDQGLIPVKLIAFDEAINTTLGLPFVRTSPDHGTALDIAGKFKARETSMIAAMNNAWILSQ